MLGWLYLTRFGAIKTQRQATGKQLSRRGIRLPVLRPARKVSHCHSSSCGDNVSATCDGADISVSVCTDNDAAASTPRSRTEDSVGVVDGEAFDDNSDRVSLDNSGDETYGPQPKEESEDDEGERDGTDEEEKDDRVHEGTPDDAVQVLRHSYGDSQL
ncbi:hypothetical protein PI125_g12476 [Phytophthora idaei]|nr:hypothetical protein PI125_g12476 [Phytophthora idaei]KAG3135246.1 hypothetical protein PI126_g18334 [Phytophthora idaei]